MGKDGTRTMIDILYKLFRDVGVLETMTNDGGPEFTSEKLQDLIQKYGVHRRLTSVGFAHANSRAELTVKSAKKLLWENNVALRPG